MQSVDECFRGHSVRVFRLDQAGVVARLRERAASLLARRPEVVEIRLFGSLARGAGHPGSDADLFIVVHDGAGPFLERIPDLARELGGIGIGCDLIVYTESERADLAGRDDAFARAVLRDGIVLASRAAGANRP